MAERFTPVGTNTTVVRINDESGVGAARRTAGRLGNAAGMSESEVGLLAIAVTEAAANIARHGREGMIFFRLSELADEAAVEMIAVDSGPGIRDIGRALTDGFSTGGTPGNGLGAIGRAASEFDLWSEPGSGTALVARFAVRGKHASPRVRVGVVCTPAAGESVCGDAWIVEPVNTGFMIGVVDGLGHGPDAAFAADTALDIVRRNKTKEPVQILEATNNALRPTRGAAVQIVVLDLRAREIRSAGVGNIAASVIGREKSKTMPSHPGIVGHQMPRARETVLPWDSDSLLSMHSDGISARWLLEKYPGVRLRHPSLAAALIYRDFARARDDATILMLSETGTSNGLGS